MTLRPERQADQPYGKKLEGAQKRLLELQQELKKHQHNLEDFAANNGADSVKILELKEQARKSNEELGNIVIQKPSIIGSVFKNFTKIKWPSVGFSKPRSFDGIGEVISDWMSVFEEIIGVGNDSVGEEIGSKEFGLENETTSNEVNLSINHSAEDVEFIDDVADLEVDEEDSSDIVLFNDNQLIEEDLDVLDIESKRIVPESLHQALLEIQEEEREAKNSESISKGKTKETILNPKDKESIDKIINQQRILQEKGYESISLFKDGIARATDKNGLQFHIDEDYEPLYSDKYDFVSGFSEGFARVKLNGRMFHIDQRGQRLYPQSYYKVGSFIDGVAKVEAEKNQMEIYVNTQGERVVKDLGTQGWIPVRDLDFTLLPTTDNKSQGKVYFKPTRSDLEEDLSNTSSNDPEKDFREDEEVDDTNNDAKGGVLHTEDSEEGQVENRTIDIEPEDFIKLYNQAIQKEEQKNNPFKGLEHSYFLTELNEQSYSHEKDGYVKNIEQGKLDSDKEKDTKIIPKENKAILDKEVAKQKKDKIKKDIDYTSIDLDAVKDLVGEMMPDKDEGHMLYNAMTKEEQKAVREYLISTIDRDKPLTNLQTLAKFNGLGKKNFLQTHNDYRKTNSHLKNSSVFEAYNEKTSPELLNRKLKGLNYPGKKDFEAMQMFQDKYELIDGYLKEVRDVGYFANKKIEFATAEKFYLEMVGYFNAYTSLEKFESDYEEGNMLQELEAMKLNILSNAFKEGVLFSANDKYGYIRLLSKLFSDYVFSYSERLPGQISEVSLAIKRVNDLSYEAENSERSVKDQLKSAVNDLVNLDHELIQGYGTLLYSLVFYKDYGTELPEEYNYLLQDQTVNEVPGVYDSVNSGGDQPNIDFSDLESVDVDNARFDQQNKVQNTEINIIEDESNTIITSDSESLVNSTLGVEVAPTISETKPEAREHSPEIMKASLDIIQSFNQLLIDEDGYLTKTRKQIRSEHTNDEMKSVEVNVEMQNEYGRFISKVRTLNTQIMDEYNKYDFSTVSNSLTRSLKEEGDQITQSASELSDIINYTSGIYSNKDINLLRININSQARYRRGTIELLKKRLKEKTIHSQNNELVDVDINNNLGTEVDSIDTSISTELD